MTVRDLLAPKHRLNGTSCKNCAHLACDYDLDSNRGGKWVCQKHEEFNRSGLFPFKEEMSCFEPCFLLTIFAQRLGRSDHDYEQAFSRFSEHLAVASLVEVD